MALLRLSNPFVYPGINPGFDPSHNASGKAVFSGISAPNGFQSLLTPSLAKTITGTVTYKIDPSIGPAAFCSAATSEINYTLAGSFSGGTLACIYTPTSIGAGGNTISMPGSPDGVWLYGNDGTNKFQVYNGVNAVLVGTVEVGKAYFIAASFNATTTNLLARNLITGQLYTISSAVTSLSTNAFTTIGVCSDGASNPQHGGLAAAMVNTRYMTLRELIAWADGPWDFWYPSATQRQMLNSFKAPSPAGPLYAPLRVYLRR